MPSPGSADKAKQDSQGHLNDTGERMIPPSEGELSIVFERHRFAYQYVKSMASGKSVLDVGCGTGYGCVVLAESARRVVGMDNSKDALSYCKAFSSERNIEYRWGDAASLELQEKFDLVVSFQLIEHLVDPLDFVRRLKRMTTPGGTIVITTPNSRVGLGSRPDNPFHISEMTYLEFSGLMTKCFGSFQILGIGYVSRNLLRQIVLRSPLYRLARLLKRRSNLKKVAARAMGVTNVQILRTEIEQNAIDLLAVCTNP